MTTVERRVLGQPSPFAAMVHGPDRSRAEIGMRQADFLQKAFRYPMTRGMKQHVFHMIRSSDAEMSPALLDTNDFRLGRAEARGYVSFCFRGGLILETSVLFTAPIRCLDSPFEASSHVDHLEMPSVSSPHSPVAVAQPRQQPRLARKCQSVSDRTDRNMHEARTLSKQLPKAGRQWCHSYAGSLVDDALRSGENDKEGGRVPRFQEEYYPMGYSKQSQLIFHIFSPPPFHTHQPGPLVWPAHHANRIRKVICPRTSQSLRTSPPTSRYALLSDDSTLSL